MLLEQSLDIVKGCTPVVAEIEWVDWPASSMVRIVFFCGEERDHMMMVVGNMEACELFYTQTYYSNIYLCLCGQTKPAIA